jgi:hypothetical protein
MAASSRPQRRPRAEQLPITNPPRTAGHTPSLQLRSDKPLNWLWRSSSENCYCTVREIVTECFTVPDIPFIVTVYVPAGVPGLPVPLLWAVLLQAASKTTTAVKAPMGRRLGLSLRPDLVTSNVQVSTSNRVSHVELKALPVGSDGNLPIAEDGAVVDIVTVEVAVLEPGTTEGGENEHKASDGSPEQLRETEPSYEPNGGATVTVSVTDCPGWTIALDWAIDIVKSPAWMT